MSKLTACDFEIGDIAYAMRVDSVYGVRMDHGVVVDKRQHIYGHLEILKKGGEKVHASSTRYFGHSFDDAYSQALHAAEKKAKEANTIVEKIKQLKKEGSGDEK